MKIFNDIIILGGVCMSEALTYDDMGVIQVTENRNFIERAKEWYNNLREDYKENYIDTGKAQEFEQKVEESSERWSDYLRWAVPIGQKPLYDYGNSESLYEEGMPGVDHQGQLPPWWRHPEQGAGLCVWAVGRDWKEPY